MRKKRSLAQVVFTVITVILLLSMLLGLLTVVFPGTS